MFVCFSDFRCDLQALLRRGVSQYYQAFRRMLLPKAQQVSSRVRDKRVESARAHKVRQNGIGAAAAINEN